MKLGPLHYFGGAALAWVVGCVLLVPRDRIPEPDEPHPLPPLDPNVPGGGVAKAWRPVELPDVTLWGGHLYRAEVDLPPFTSALVSQSAVEKRAEGFDRVRYWTDPPKDWPDPKSDADLFVEGRYVAKFKDSRTLPGRIIRAWEWA